MAVRHDTVLGSLAEDLERDSGLSVATYDVLVHLSDAPGGQLRVGELAERLLLSRSWLNRRIERLERAGLVAREGAEEDGRGTLARLTPRGEDVVEAAMRSYLRSVRRHFLAHLSEAEQHSLVRILSKPLEAARKP